MRHGPFILLAAISLVAARPTDAQIAQIAAPQPTTVLARASTDDMVARLLTFDRNSDGKVQSSELLERMQPLMARGDANGDGVLDPAELRTLAAAPRTQIQARGFGGGSYVVGDFGDFSSFLRIESAIDDLRLDASRRRRALTEARAYVAALEKAAGAALLAELAGTLMPSELAAFKTALSQNRQPQLLTSTEGGVRTVVRLETTQLEQFLRRYDMPAANRARAHAAIQRYRTQLRVDDSERIAVAAHLGEILSQVERADLAAALARRPVVAAGRVAFGTLPINTGTVLLDDALRQRIITAQPALLVR